MCANFLVYISTYVDGMVFELAKFLRKSTIRKAEIGVVQSMISASKCLNSREIAQVILECISENNVLEELFISSNTKPEMVHTYLHTYIHLCIDIRIYTYV